MLLGANVFFLKRTTAIVALFKNFSNLIRRKTRDTNLRKLFHIELRIQDQIELDHLESAFLQ